MEERIRPERTGKVLVKWRCRGGAFWKRSWLKRVWLLGLQSGWSTTDGLGVVTDLMD